MGYTPNAGNIKEYTVGGLAAALGKLLTIDGSTPGKSVLAEEVEKQPVVDVLVPALATVGTDDTKKVYTKGIADTSFVKTDGSNISTQADQGKALVDVLVPALTTGGTNDTRVYTKTDADNKFNGKVNLAGDNLQLPAFVAVLAKDDGSTGIYTTQGVNDELTKKADTSAIPAAPDLSNYLETSKLAQEVSKQPVVDVLVPALATAGTDDTKKVYTKTAADNAFVKADGTNAGNILAGLRVPTADAVADALKANSIFTNAIKTHANAQDAGFQGAVKNVMSQQHFDIPADDSAPISVDW